MPTAAGAPRIDNRRAGVLDAAAASFRRKGFAATSMRDIATAAGMLPGSLYYHFASKDDLLLAVYEEGVRRIAERVDDATSGVRDPRARLEAGCVAHLEMLLERGDYAQVVIRVFPDDAPAVRDRLVRLRDDYERRFRALVDEAAPGAFGGRRMLRLFLLGALNWSQQWYALGPQSPAEIARDLLACLDLDAPARARRPGVRAR